MHIFFLLICVKMLNLTKDIGYLPVPVNCQNLLKKKNLEKMLIWR